MWGIWGEGNEESENIGETWQKKKFYRFVLGGSGTDQSKTIAAKRGMLFLCFFSLCLAKEQAKV